MFKPGVSIAQGASALFASREPVNPDEERWTDDPLLIPSPPPGEVRDASVRIVQTCTNAHGTVCELPKPLQHRHEDVRCAGLQLAA